MQFQQYFIGITYIIVPKEKKFWTKRRGEEGGEEEENERVNKIKRDKMCALSVPFYDKHVNSINY